MNRRKRRADRSGRKFLRSPGRPSVAGREERRLFWAAIAATAAAASGISTEGNDPRRPHGRGESIIERELRKCVQRDGHKPQHTVVDRPAGWSGPSQQLA